MNKLNEIKKLLYKQNPEAKFISIRKGVASYDCNVETEDDVLHIWFSIPVSDMGDAAFTWVMDAKNLIRWIEVTEDYEKEHS